MRMRNGSTGTVKHLLDTPRRARILAEWKKAVDRLGDDPDGAITSARTLLETVCRYVLDELGVPYAPDGDLPKMHARVADALGISAAKATSDINRRFFGSVHTIVQAVGELRNRIGDAHGRSGIELHASRSQAELAVRLAEAMTKFLLMTFDAHVETAHRLSPDGQAVLKFDTTTVWRLMDHARNAPGHRPAMDDDEGPAPALWLVGDAGIYLMSNGSPPILQDGKVATVGQAAEKRRLCAFAEGCGPEAEVDDWRPIHTAIEGGDDFCRTLPVDFVLRALEHARRHVVILASPDGTKILSDVDWNDGKGTVH